MRKTHTMPQIGFGFSFSVGQADCVGMAWNGQSVVVLPAATVVRGAVCKVESPELHSQNEDPLHTSSLVVILSHALLAQVLSTYWREC